MKMDLRPFGSLSAIAFGLLVLTGVAQAQTAGEAPAQSPRLPQQIIPSGAEDAPQALRAAAASRQAEQQQLERQLIEMTSESSTGLVPVSHANGTVTVDLEGRFMSVLVATPSEDGGVAVSCHTGHEVLDAANHAHDVSKGQAPKAPAIERHASVPQPAAEEK
jgi:hypothetical protein